MLYIKEKKSPSSSYNDFFHVKITTLNQNFALKTFKNELHRGFLLQQCYLSTMSELVRKYVKDKVVNNFMNAINYKVTWKQWISEWNTQEYKENFEKDNDLVIIKKDITNREQCKPYKYFYMMYLNSEYDHYGTKMKVLISNM